MILISLDFSCTGFARITRWKLVNSSEDQETVTAQFGKMAGASGSGAPAKQSYGHRGLIQRLDTYLMMNSLGLDHSMISEEHRQMWPFDFELVYTVILSADTLETHLRVQNIGDKAFDFNTLLHTYFLIPVRWSKNGSGPLSLALEACHPLMLHLTLSKLPHTSILGCFQGQGHWIERRELR